MSEKNEILRKFAEFNFVRFKFPAIKKPEEEIWLRLSPGVDNLEHVICLDFKPSVKAYSIHVGVYSPVARKLVEAVLPIILNSIAPIYSAVPDAFARPCWRMFDAGRALNWKSIYVMPDPYDRSNWQKLFNQLFSDFINPIFLAIKEPVDVIGLLYRNYPPFEWDLGVPLLRLAEIIALAKISNIDRLSLERRLCKFNEIVDPTIYPPHTFEEIKELLFQKIYNISNSPLP